MTSFIHSFTKRSAVLFVALALVAGTALPAKAATIDQLQLQIASLMAQIAALQAGTQTSAQATFTRDLTIGAQGADVTQLQNWLISRGHAIPAGATGYFGAQTAAALAAYQRANGITPAVGYFGPVTRAKVNATIVTTPTTPTTPGTGNVLRGGAGSIDSFKLLSGLNNEEVGEDEEDVEVAGLEVEVDDGSDIRFTSVRLTFDEGTANRDFKRYASEVSIMLDGNEIARVDADEFTKRNNWSKNISVDSDAIIRAGKTGELTVAVSAISNLDSADEGETWTVDFAQVRFMDADGASITEDPGTAARTFSFEAFAKAANVGLRITEGDEDVNDSRVIIVDANKRTENEDVLSFNVEVEGDSDIELSSLPIAFTVTGADFLDDMASSVTLSVDGDEVASENVRADNNTVVFDDLDLTLEAGETYEFTVSVDFLALSSTLDEGDTIEAAFGETQTNSNDFDAEDESGEELGDNDIKGSVIGGAHAVYENGIDVTFVSASQEVTSVGDDAGEADQGTYRIVFDVTARGEDMRIDRSCAENQVNVAGQGVEYTISEADKNTTVCLLSSSSSDSEDTANTFEVDENRTRRFTLTVVATATADHFAQVSLDSINWGAATNDTNTNYYDFNLNSFRTSTLFLNYVD